MPSEFAIWTEKYRPHTFEEVQGQKDIVSKVKAFVTQKNMPHLLFAGPAGVGKTTLALVMARQLFGDDWRGNFLELNASDERGIDVIRVKVKDFARTRAIGDVPFKIIYLDECLDYGATITVRDEFGAISNCKIGDFVETKEPERYHVLSVDDNGAMVFSKIQRTMRIPHDPAKGFYHLRIHDREVRITGNHQVITPRGWSAVQDLHPGDLVLCPLQRHSSFHELSSQPIEYDLVGLPREIKKKERYLARAPELRIIELLASSETGLSRTELTRISGISSTKLSSILSPRRNPYYLSLPAHGIVRRVGAHFALTTDKTTAISRLADIKRHPSPRNDAYVQEELAKAQLFPMSPENARIVARLVGHLFGDGCLSLKTKQVFFSGKEEDMRTIRSDLNSLGFHGLGDIRRNTWRNGECWSFAGYKIAWLSLFYSLGVPVGRKTDTPVRVPSWILTAGPDIKREFLAAFFGAEGTKPSFQGRTIKPIVIGQAKREDLRENLEEYLAQLQHLLAEFKIETGVRITSQTKNIRCDGTRTIEGKIWVKNSQENILRFLEQVGYVYCRNKEEETNPVRSYLYWRRSGGLQIRKYKAPHFKEWRQHHVLGESAYGYVTRLSREKDPEFVYCLTTEHQKFIANDIIVHNCDALTREAQQALRRTMENYTQTCRFILSCNYSSKIIDPIQSRCTVFRFKPLAHEEISKIIKKVAHAEGLHIDAKAEEAIVSVSGGDVRRVENLLQACAAFEKKITEDVVFSIAGYAKPKEVAQLLELTKKGDFIEARKKLLNVMLEYGLSGYDVVKQLQQAIWQVEGIDDRRKLEMVKACGEAEFRMVEGSDAYLQLEALLAAFTLEMKK
jgi:replication factor C small subunit